VWISAEVCEIFDVEIHNARIEKASNEIDTENGITSFLVSGRRNQTLN
jgi:hypothetical protein